MSGAAYAQTDAKSYEAVQMQQGDFYASDLIGMRIYNSETPVQADAKIAAGADADWDDIGEINDIIVTKDGKVSAVILGVGGFLGVGERDVAVPMSAITVLHEEGNDDPFLVVSTSKEALEATPEYKRMDGDMKAGDAKADMDTKAAMDTKATDTDADTKATADTTAAPAVNDGTMLTRPSVTREGYEDADMAAVSQMTSDELEGTTVYGPKDENVGEIDNLIVGDDGKVEKVIINVGGFLGLGEKPVAVTFDELQVLKETDGDDYRIYIDSTEENLKALPEYKSE